MNVVAIGDDKQSQVTVLRQPVAEDAMSLHRLVEQSPPLDTNSAYCNLLHCTHFAATSVAAEVAGELAGFVSGYQVPERPDTLFVWQVAVAVSARGQGLAGRMLDHLLARPACHAVNYVETTITSDNHASWTLFRHFAGRHGAGLESGVWFDREDHFAGEHDSEHLLRIGPFKK